MKNILLLGDSIRINYQSYVEDKLKDKANVYYTRDKGLFCHYTLRYLHEWIGAISNHGEFSFDIIHFNCGLWDVLRLAGENRTFLSEKEYEEGLKRIINRIRFLCPDAKVIFALSTSVIEPGFEPGEKVGERRNEDISNFNSIAIKVCNEMNVMIDDLWTVSNSLSREAHSDLVHFETTEGISALGENVVKSILNCL